MMVPKRETARTSYLLCRCAMRVVQLAVAAAVLVLAALVASATANAAADDQSPGATVDIREQVTVSSATIVLDQVAEISACDADAQSLADIEIGPSPLAGHQRTITAGYIRMRIARAGFGRADVAIGGAAAITVRREALAAAVPVQSPTVSRAPAAPAVGSALHEPPAPEPIIAKRGTNVKITVISGCVTVTAAGQLTANTAVGEYASARVKTTGRQVFGQLQGPNEMIVRL